MGYFRKQKLPKRLPKKVGTLKVEPREYSGMQYVLAKDIIDGFGKKWYKVWETAYGSGHTGLMIPPNDLSHKLSEPQFGIYYHDFLMVSNLIDRNEPTFFD